MTVAKDVILVNETDQVIGAMEKIEAHRKGLLHRAFSVFIFNSKGEMLLQQRARNKYHSADLWTNACCSHPAPGESTLKAAEQRLLEEMGFTTPLQKVFQFTYKTEFDNGLTENEYDHVFAGTWDGLIAPQKDEVSDYCFKTMHEIQSSLLTHPQKYTTWFHIAFPQIEQWAKENILVKSPLFS
jgi:isopentenyl-diphosphate Delta-isomerase